MTTISLEEAAANFLGVVEQLQAGEEVLIVKASRPVARLIRETGSLGAGRREPGSMIGKLTIIEEDDAHLEDFKDYMP